MRYQRWIIPFAGASSKLLFSILFFNEAIWYKSEGRSYHCMLSFKLIFLVGGRGHFGKSLEKPCEGSYAVKSYRKTNISHCNIGL